MPQEMVNGLCEIRGCAYLDPIKCECLAERCIYDRCREDVADNDDVGTGKQRESTGRVRQDG